MRRLLPAFAGLLLAAVLAWVAGTASFTDDVARLVPHEGSLAEAMAAVQAFRVADTLLVEVDGEGRPAAEWQPAVAALARALERDPRWAEVRWRVTADEGLALHAALAPHAVELLPPEVLAQRTSEAGIRRTLEDWMARLYGPTGALVERALEVDPLNLARAALDEVRRAGSPFRVEASQGLLLDASGGRAVLLLTPALTALELGPDPPLLRDLEAELASLGLPARFYGGPRVAAATAAQIRDDVTRASLLGSTLLVVVVVLGFRSLRPVAGALPSLALAVSAAGAVAAWRSPVHAVNLGFAGALAGIAIDYWIHLYVAAADRDAPTRLDAALDALADLRPALLLSGGSTAAAFGVLTFSSFPVVEDLGWTGVAATLGALLGVFLLGPVTFSLVGRRASSRPVRLPPGIGGLTVACTLLGAIALPFSRFDGDPRHLAAVPAELEALERSLTNRYGGFGTTGLLALTGPTLESVLDAADRAVAAVTEVPGVSVSGPGTLLPGPAERARRRAALPDAADVQARLDAVAAEVGFAPGAFAGAVERAFAPPTAGPSPATWTGTPGEAALARHLRRTAGGWEAMVALVLVDDAVADGVVLALDGALGPGTYTLALPAQLASQGVQAIRLEIVRLGAVGLAVVGVVLALRYRRVRPVLAAFAPVLAAVCGAVGLEVLLGQPWNAVSAGAMVLVLGLALDYGVFSVEGARSGHADASRRGVLLSAGTTLATVGALAVARSPALAATGLAVFGGVLGAAAMGLAVVAPAQAGERWIGPWGRHLAGGVGFGLLVWLHLDALVAHRAYVKAPPVPPGSDVGHTLDAADPADRRFGPNRLVLRDGMRLMRLEGDPYERGYANRVLAGNLETTLERETLASFSDAVPNPVARYLVARGSLLGGAGLERHWQREHLVELRGVTDGGADPYWWLDHELTRKLYYHALHDIGQLLVDAPFVVACTGFMAGPGATPDGHWRIGRNFDFDGGPVFDRDKIVVVHVPDEGIPFLSIIFSGMVGAVTGVNRDGVAVAIQAAGSDDWVRPGTPMTLIVREILQYASSIEEARAILEARKGMVSENVLVVDAEAGRGVLFEVSPRRLGELEVEGSLGVANHFRSATFADDAENARRRDTWSTGPRQSRMDALLTELHGSIDDAVAVRILTDRAGVDGRPLPDGHRAAIDADIATHSAVIDATARSVWVSRYPNTAGGYVEIRLEDVLAGVLEPREVVPAGDLGRTLAVHRSRDLVAASRAESPAEAEVLAREALELSPGHPQALSALGRALIDLGRPEEAREVLQQALMVPPAYQDKVDEVRAMLAEIE